MPTIMNLHRIFFILSISSLFFSLSVQADQHHETKHASLDDDQEPHGPASYAQDESDSLILVDMESDDAPASSPSEDQDHISSTPSSSPEPPSSASLWEGLGLSRLLYEAQASLEPIQSSILNQAEAMFSPLSPSILGPETDGPTPGPSPFSEAPTIAPDSPSSSPVPAQAPDAPLSSPVPASAPGPSGLIDHDVALAIEAHIKQGQTAAQLAMDEANRLLKDPQIASSETGKCLSKCVDQYAASLDKLNKAITDLGVRDVTLLADDFGAVEADISTCQACFKENIGEDSPLKPLEEATTNAARECLTF